ncbi:MAG: hypothetical protein H0W29_15170 [Gemmatimonadales bacterium]|nr:hypothetical protein [Gemmatimonadales bacterium]
MLGLGGASLQRDLHRLVNLGILGRTTDGRLTRYHPLARPNFWAALRLLLSDLDDPARLVSDALLDVSGIKAAFLFGSVAAGADRPESDV